MTIGVGDVAPTFSLPGKPGEEAVSLENFRGEKNVILLFFPLAFSPVCAKELCGIRDNYDLYESLGAQVLGISVDSPFALSAWAEQEGFSFPLLSDFNREVSSGYGVLFEDLMGLKGVSKRAVFVIDKTGVIRHMEVLKSAGDLPSFSAVRDSLEELG